MSPYAHHHPHPIVSCTHSRTTHCLLLPVLGQYSCNEELLPGASVVQFGGATLHPKCYRCAWPCAMQLSVGDPVYTHHAAPWCKRCYAADAVSGTSMRCCVSSCLSSKTSLHDRYVQRTPTHTDTRHLHRQERECWRCKESIQFDNSGKLAGVTAGNISFHKECYNCYACHKAFAVASGDGEKVSRLMYSVNEHACVLKTRL